MEEAGVAKVDRVGRRPRWGRSAVVAIGAAVLLGPVVYSFASGPGQTGRSPGGVPPLGLVHAVPSGPAAGRPGASLPPLPAGTSASGVPAGPTTPTAVGPGGLGSGGPPRTTTTPVTTKAPAVPPGLTFTAIAGTGCANNETGNWYTNGWSDSTWFTASGGYSGSGCDGTFVAMPTSGDPTVNGSEYTVWWFETGPVVTGSCAVSVYIPASTSAAGQPAYYKILGGRTSSTVQATFTIDQTAHRGSWVSAGSFPVANGAISVHLANRGAAGLHLGAAQVRVSCTG